METDMSGNCPKDNALVALAMNEAGPSAGQRLLRHLAVCPRCAIRFRVLRDLGRDLGPAVESYIGAVDASKAGALLRQAAARELDRLDPSASLSARFSRGARSLRSFGLEFAGGLLIALFIALGAGYFAVYRPFVRTGERSPSANLELISPAGRQARVPGVFRWSPVLQAEDYTIEVRDESLARVFQGSTYLVNELVCPAELRSKLVRGKTYLWTVSAHDESGTLLASRSATFVVE